MANFCSNSVAFTGDPEQVLQVRSLFEEIEHQQAKTGLYHLPDFISEKDGFMQDISFSKDHIHFETRWMPNLDVLAKIADHFNVGFVNCYSEMMCGIYGEAVYGEGILTCVNLPQEDFQKVHYDRDRNGYVLDGEVFEFEGDLLDVLLEKQKLLHCPFGHWSFGHGPDR